MTTNPQDKAASAWRTNAPLLAGWVRDNLINRTDVWGAYPSLNRRDKYKSYTAPGREKRGKVSLLKSTIERHFAGRDHGDVIGLHSTSATNTSRWVLVDVDAHDGSNADPAVNEAAAKWWFDKLTSLGFNSLLTDSNGKGGFHLLVLFDKPVSTPAAFDFVTELVSDFATVGLTKAPEVFPKQREVERGGYGNWARLPGLHHTREHWSKAWHPERGWLDGYDAVETILATEPNNSELVPPAKVTPPPAPKPMPKARGNRSGLMSDEQIAVEALKRIPNSGHDDYDEWIRIGQALHAVDQGGGMLAAWDSWSSSSADYTTGECDQKWKTFNANKGKRVTLGSLIELARKYDPTFLKPRTAPKPSPARLVITSQIQGATA